MSKIRTTDSKTSIIRRAFSEFLLLPSVIIVLFLALAFFTNQLDQEQIKWLNPVRLFLQKHIFSNPKATSDLLSAIVSGTISVTTLTTTLLLVIVQQSAGSMTTQVFDQFLRRRTNQFYLGFFVGLALYSMIILATVNEPFNPVWGGTLAFCLTAVALYLLVLLMYTTIDQMRPAEIINAIYERILKARERQLEMMAFTIPNDGKINDDAVIILCEKGGFITNINTKHLSAFIADKCAGSKLIFNNSTGSYIAFGEELASMIISQPQHEAILKKEILKNVSISLQRNIDFDAAYGIEQLETIAWTSSSTAHSNPAPGNLCVNTMHNILGSFCDEKKHDKNEHAQNIYYTDNTFEELMRGFENLAVVSSESMQHQVFGGILNTVTTTIDKLSIERQKRLQDVVLLMLSVMGDHALTKALEKALIELTDKLNALQMHDTVQCVQEALNKLRNTLGKLNSRSTRA